MQINSSDTNPQSPRWEAGELCKIIGRLIGKETDLQSIKVMLGSLISLKEETNQRLEADLKKLRESRDQISAQKKEIELLEQKLKQKKEAHNRQRLDLIETLRSSMTQQAQEAKLSQSETLTGDLKEVRIVEQVQAENDMKIIEQSQSNNFIPQDKEGGSPSQSESLQGSSMALIKEIQPNPQGFQNKPQTNLDDSWQSQGRLQKEQSLTSDSRPKQSLQVLEDYHDEAQTFQQRRIQNAHQDTGTPIGQPFSGPKPTLDQQKVQTKSESNQLKSQSTNPNSFDKNPASSIRTNRSDESLPCFKIAMKQRERVNSVIDQFRKNNQIPLKPSKRQEAVLSKNDETLSYSQSSKTKPQALISKSIEVQKLKELKVSETHQTINSSRLSSKLSMFNEIQSSHPARVEEPREEAQVKPIEESSVSSVPNSFSCASSQQQSPSDQKFMQAMEKLDPRLLKRINDREAKKEDIERFKQVLEEHKPELDSKLVTELSQEQKAQMGIRLKVEKGFVIIYGLDDGKQPESTLINEVIKLLDVYWINEKQGFDENSLDSIVKIN